MTNEFYYLMSCLLYNDQNLRLKYCLANNRYEYSFDDLFRGGHINSATLRYYQGGEKIRRRYPLPKKNDEDKIFERLDSDDDVANSHQRLCNITIYQLNNPSLVL